MYHCLKLKKIKEGWTKYILRKGINDLLPESIVWRKNLVLNSR
jgi:asparagine synthase (glutamine-hydrolysing)